MRGHRSFEWFAAGGGAAANSFGAGPSGGGNYQIVDLDQDQGTLDGLAVLAVPVDPAIPSVGQAAAIQTGQVTGARACETVHDK